MKYVILSDSNNVEPFIIPRQLSVVNGETLIERTIRLLNENGIRDAIITSHDKRFDDLGAKRYEPKFNDYSPRENKGYWLNAFPKELLNEPITFLFGDVYYSENAIKTIVETETNSVLFFCSDKNKGYSDKYIKHHDEPLAFKVVDYDLFKEHIEIVKDMFDKGLTGRHPIAWELYRSINGLDVNKHILIDNYVAINDETCDIDCLIDIDLLKMKLGGMKMVKVEAIGGFTLEKFDELKNIERVNPSRDEKGRIYLGDIFECDEAMAKYLLGENEQKLTVIKVLEVVPEVNLMSQSPVEELEKVKDIEVTTTVEDAKEEDNASNIEQEAQVQVKKGTNKKTGAKNGNSKQKNK